MYENLVKRYRFGRKKTVTKHWPHSRTNATTILETFFILPKQCYTYETKT